MRKLSPATVAIAAALLWLAFYGNTIPGCPLPNVINPPPAPGETLVIMLYEAEHGQLPDYAVGAARELVKAKVQVKQIDDDVLDGLGAVPIWLQPVLEEGRKIMGGMSDAEQKDDALLKVVGGKAAVAMKMPATEAAILEAVK